MNGPSFSARISPLVVGVSAFGLLLAACNRQPNPSATEAPMVAPPAAALPMATAAPASVPPAPPVAALPPAPRPVRYAPQPGPQAYGYIDQAYSMAQAFADTPPDYAVDYGGTRPWIWRAGNGAYRVVERLPQGERYYYYQPGQDYPFFVQDPDYGYAYDSSGLAAVYGPDGARIADAIAARRAEEASRYLERARELYRAAQYDRRQSAYASEWASRRDDLRRRELAWQEQQASNAEWRDWHDAHQAQEQQQWRRERDQRLAYAAALGLAGAARPSAGRNSVAPAGPLPNPDEVAKRQAAYFSKWREGRQSGSGSQVVASRGAPAANPQIATPVSANAPAQRNAELKQAQAAAAQARLAQVKAAQAAHAQQAAAQTAERQAAAAKAKAAQAERAQQLAVQAQRRQAVADKAKIAQAQHAQKLAEQAKQREAAVAKAKAAEAAHAQQVAAQAKQRQAAAAQARAAEAKTAQAKAAQARVAEMKAAQAKAAEARAAQAKAAEAKVAQAKAAGAARRQQLAEAKQKAAAAKPHANKPKKNEPAKNRKDEKPQ